MNVELLINTTGDISDAPDMYHPEYGWLRVDNKTTEAGLEYFQDQLEKANPPKLVGHA